MIYVSKNQLDQVEYLLDQSAQGNHLLFDIEIVRSILSQPGKIRLAEEEAYGVEHHIEHIILKPSLAEKKAYLERLDSETFEKVVKTYFNIVENNIFENLEIKH